MMPANGKPPLQVLSPLLLLAVVLFGGQSTKADNPCKTVAKSPNIGKEGIRCIGRVKSDLLVMTNDFNIWQIPAPHIDKGGIDKSINSLYFGEDPPIPVDEKWPGLNNFAGWHDNRNKTRTCNPAVDANGEYLLIDGKSFGIILYIDKNVAYTGYGNNHVDIRARWISTSEPAKMYIMTDSRGFLEARLYSSCTKRYDGMVDNVFYVKEGVDGCLRPMGFVLDDGKRCNYTDPPPYRTLCMHGKNQVYFGEVNDTKCESAKWRIENGFVDKGHFYLFGTDSVITFPESTYKKKQKSAYRTIPYNVFIKCSADSHPRDVNAQKKNALIIGLVVALALILLICCLCILLCLVREAMVRRKKGKKGMKNGKHAGNFVAPATARSGGLFSPLGLSKRIFSMSKRSKGLTPGRKLTKAGGSMRTKRSSGPNNPANSLSRGPSAVSTKRSTRVGGSSKGHLTSNGKGPSKAETVRSKRISGGRSGGSIKKSGGRASGQSNKATERSKLKNR